ncbi:hypothetical protein BCF33_0534 [Hasllibacter halocynthiae]|uniref:Uncharacterized protein n=1 Tax=Hasllibacter halocynthiae TaxID=595589 RepID=A0A2T0X7K3_9RHOB|nr:hypothetical protein [Hasllibacter halocynthiae]PRY94931.1 hypothetical protein BCF33_0534 [Hasllibacter halocynthiae]
MTRALLLVAALLAAAHASAQQIASPSEFLDAAEGRTMTFVGDDTGALVGTERFLSRERTVWARADGSCSYGRVFAQGPELCFEYEDDAGRLHCWWPFRQDGTLKVRSTSTLEVQRIARISDDMVGCEGEPIS